ncbi:MAG: hypothetical protein HUU34_08475 [Saprospiraceae bacterium]|nr:hypothetical protein [Saprospiraceae bacterium]
MFYKLIQRIRKWFADRKERRIEKLTARANQLPDGKAIDLLELQQKGLVRAKATGQSIEVIHAQVESLVRKRLLVLVSPGTYFVSSGSHQNMVTKRPHTFTLYPLDTTHFSVGAACINANLPIPGEKDMFYGVRKVSDDLVRFLEAAQGEDSMTVQAGVWAITDGFSAYQLQHHLYFADRYGNNRRQAIGNDNIAKAKQILQKLSIRTNL